MNQKQLRIMWIGVAAAIIMVLFPPWEVARGGQTSFKRDYGYGFIASPPKVSPGGVAVGRISPTINIDRLALQMCVVAILSGAGIVASKNSR